jgi:hypothetical protein
MISESDIAEGHAGAPGKGYAGSLSRSFTTTLRYIALADKMKKSAERVFVPEFLKPQKGRKRR